MDKESNVNDNKLYVDIDKLDESSIVKTSYIDNKDFSTLVEQINAIDYKNGITINSVNTSINCKIIKQNKRINKLYKDIEKINEIISINYKYYKIDKDSIDNRIESIESDLLKLKNEYNDFKHIIKAFNFYFICVIIIIIFIMIVGGIY